jgi:glycosyltransferase involved in cell wall biosynthesis
MYMKSRTIVAFSTSWGARFGGINSFNHDLICAFAGILFDEVNTLCVVLNASAEDVENAAREQVRLIQIKVNETNSFLPSFEEASWEAIRATGLNISPEETVWLGHDRITGAIALAAAAARGGRAALIHHMSYSSYEAYAETSSLAKQKEEEQRLLFESADIVLAVGPLLRDALADMLDRDEIHMVVPGLPDIQVRRSPRTFKAFISGRLGDDAKKIKQAHLGIAAFGDAIRQADENNLLPELLRGEREPRLTLRGVDFELSTFESDASSEMELKRFAEQYAGRAFALHALPFTTQRNALFADLASASLAMMPSWHEGFGLVAWEAIGAGVPLILSKKSGVYRLLSELDHGIFTNLILPIDVAGSSNDPYFLEKDRISLTQAIVKIAKDVGEWKNRAARLREELARRYSWAECARSLIKFLNWDLGARRVDAENFISITNGSNNESKPILEFLQNPVSLWNAHSGLSESQLLRAEEGIVPFDSKREPFLAEQLQWAKSREFTIAIRLLTGQGGVGKTRLGLEMLSRLEADGWVGGFLRGDCDIQQAIMLGSKIEDLGRACIVVIDYAETRQVVLLAFLKSLLNKSLRANVRILLLARDGGEWWNLLPSRDVICEAILEGMASTGPFQLPELHSQTSDRQAAYQLALARFAETLHLGVPQHTPNLEEAYFALPLYIQMAALIALRGERPRSAEALTRTLVGRERRYWRKALEALNVKGHEIEDQAALLMTLASLANGLAAPSDVQKIWETCGGQKTMLRPLFMALVPLYPGRQGLDGWRPDLLGEALIAQVVLGRFGPALLQSVFSQNLQGMRHSSLTVLARMLANRPDLSQLIEDALVANFVKCASDLVKVCIETQSILPEIAERAYVRLTKKEQSQAAGLLWPHLNFEVLPLTGLDVKVSKTLLEKAERALGKGTLEDRSNYAIALSDLSVALDRDGQLVKAWEAAHEAVEMYRSLVKVRQGAYEHGLAKTLDLYATYSLNLGKVDSALVASREALEIHGKLTKVRPKDNEPDLAHSLTNYAGFLSAQGEAEEAFYISEKALNLLEKLVVSDPSRFEYGHANAVCNHANRLQDQGRSSEALKLAARGVAIGRRLIKDKPARHEPLLASYLGNYARILADQGENQQAILVSEEAVTIYKSLSKAKPARFEADLATALSNYATHLGTLGLLKDAICVNEQALSIRRRLAVTSPSRFEADLATSYSNYAVHLAEIGRIEEAVAADWSALSIRERIASVNPERFEADLAISLSNLAEHMAHMGRWSESIGFEERGLFLFNACAIRSPYIYMISRERSNFALLKWKWLNFECDLEIPEIDPKSKGYLQARSLLALEFERACLIVYVKQDIEALNLAAEKWKTLDSAWKHFMRENYLTLAILAEHLQGGNSSFEPWRDLYAKYLQESSNRIPEWIKAVAARAGATFAS